MRFVKLSRTSRRALPGLNALKTSLELLSKAGSAVPPLQVVVDTSLEIVKFAEAVKKNRKESDELVNYAREIIEAITESYSIIEREDTGEQYEKHVQALHKTLVEISQRMQELTRSGGLIRRITRKADNSEKIVTSRAALGRALEVFKIKNGAHNYRHIMVELRAVKALVAGARPHTAPNSDIARVEGPSNSGGIVIVHPRPYHPFRRQQFLMPRIAKVRESGNCLLFASKD